MADVADLWVASGALPGAQLVFLAVREVDRSRQFCGGQGRYALGRCSVAACVRMAGIFDPSLNCAVLTLPHHIFQNRGLIPRRGGEVSGSRMRVLEGRAAVLVSTFIEQNAATTCKFAKMAIPPGDDKLDELGAASTSART